MKIPKKHLIHGVSEKKLEKLNNVLFNRTVVTIYCDASISDQYPLIGIGICVVGDGCIHAEHQLIYNRYEGMVAPYAEFKAVLFAIKRLPRIIDLYSDLKTPLKEIKILSDCINIESRLSRFKNEMMKSVKKELEREKEKFTRKYPEYKLTILYLSGAKIQNTYHKIAHRSARKAINKK